ncbi:MAG: hypothetical protein KDC93_08985 [Cyclobacteriaceae bacterium]|nr:hypothetical protein [Cyclobacteriaceae bacterium]
MTLSEIATAQIQQVGRLEIPISNFENANFSVVSAGTGGLMIYRRLYSNPLDQLEIIRVDTIFRVVWSKKLEIAKGLRAVRALVKENYLFVLFKATNNKFGDFLIAAVDINSGAYTVYRVQNLISFHPTEFIITNEAALIGGYFNYRPLIVYFNFSSQKSKILPGFFNEVGELTQVKPYDDGSIDVIVSSDNYERKRCLWIKKYDAKGDLVKTTILEPGDKKNLIFGRSINIGDDQQAVVGVYGRFKEYSRGIFIARINPLGEYQIQYYDYGDLSHFFSYMKATRQERIKQRIERKKIKGKKAKFNYRFIVHEVIETKDNYVMLGEAFFPKYAYVNGLSQTRILIGYQYTHAVVIGFDKNGKLIWDNSFEVNDIITNSLNQYVKIQAQEDKIYLQYVYENEIRSKIIKDSEIIEGKAANEVKLKFDDDILRNTEFESSQLDYWYDDKLFVYGVQQIRNYSQSKENANRRVFFINKVDYK